MVGVFARGRIWFRVPEGILVWLEGQLPEGVSAKDVVLALLAKLGTDGASYSSLEIGGDGLLAMPMDERLVFANMAVELGAKVGLVDVDETTWAYTGGSPDEGLDLHATPGPHYQRELRLDLAGLEPMCAAPHSPGNIRPVAELAGKVSVQQAFIGSCTGGRITDYRAAAEVLRGNRVHPDLRLIITPGSKRIYREMLREGLVEVFADAGAIVEPAGCGPCAGLQMGVLADGENAISASNRNFRGRMGNPKSNVYLASPATVAASAIHATVTDPREVLAACSSR